MEPGGGEEGGKMHSYNFLLSLSNDQPLPFLGNKQGIIKIVTENGYQE